MTQEEHDRLVKVEERSKSNTHRIRELQEQQKNITELVQSVSAIAQKQSDMDTDLKEIKSDVKNITLKPAKRWESIVEKAILATVGILVAYVAVRMGLQS